MPGEFGPIYRIPGLTDRKAVGADTTVDVMPERFYVEVGDSRILATTAFLFFIEDLARSRAADCGERLHHADFIVTADPEKMAAYGGIHDCLQCRAGIAACRQMMTERPGVEMLVGRLFWAGGISG